MPSISQVNEHESLYCTTQQAADLAGVARNTVHNAAKYGDLPCTRTPLGRLFLRSDIEAWRLGRAVRNLSKEPHA